MEKNEKSKSVKSEESVVKQHEQASEIVLLYCASEFCEGEPIEAIPIKDKKELDCPICYHSLKQQRITMLDVCKHVFCQKCIALHLDNM